MILNVYDLSKSQSMSVIMCGSCLNWWMLVAFFLCSSQPLDLSQCWFFRSCSKLTYTLAVIGVKRLVSTINGWFSGSMLIYQRVYIYGERCGERYGERFKDDSQQKLAINSCQSGNLSPDFLSRDGSPESSRDNLWERSLTVGYGGYGKQHGHRIQQRDICLFHMAIWFAVDVREFCPIHTFCEGSLIGSWKGAMKMSRVYWTPINMELWDPIHFNLENMGSKVPTRSFD